MAVVAIILLVALLLPSGVALAKSDKFTFDNVTFSDGTMGVIEAATKITQPNKTDPAEYTVCNYYTTGYTTYLGAYASDAFFSTSASEVEQFCLDNYVNRQ